MLLAALLFSISVTLIVYFVTNRWQYRKELALRLQPIRTIEQAESALKRKDNLSDIENFSKILKASAPSRLLAHRFRMIGFRVSVSVFYLACLVFFIVCLTILRAYFPFMISLVISLVAAGLPFIAIHVCYKRYLRLFAEQLPSAISIIAGAIKVGHGLEKAIESVAQTAPFPVKDEFHIVLNEMTLGLSLPQALDNLYQRLENPDLKILVTGITIQQELGGNLSEMLENLEKTIRERIALTREVKVLSAQGKMSSWVLLSIPFILLGLYFWQNPKLMIDFVASSAGKTVLTICGMLQFVGFIGMRSVIKLGD